VSTTSEKFLCGGTLTGIQMYRGGLQAGETASVVSRKISPHDAPGGRRRTKESRGIEKLQTLPTGFLLGESYLRPESSREIRGDAHRIYLSRLLLGIKKGGKVTIKAESTSHRETSSKKRRPGAPCQGKIRTGSYAESRSRSPYPARQRD